MKWKETEGPIVSALVQTPERGWNWKGYREVKVPTTVTKLEPFMGSVTVNFEKGNIKLVYKLMVGPSNNLL